MAKPPRAPDLLGLPESPTEMRRRWRDPGFRAAWPMPDAEAEWLGRPGPSFEAYASALAGGVPEPPPRGLRGKAREEAAADAAPALAAFAARRRWALHFAYLRALYDPTFTLPVAFEPFSMARIVAEVLSEAGMTSLRKSARRFSRAIAFSSDGSTSIG